MIRNATHPRDSQPPLFLTRHMATHSLETPPNPERDKAGRAPPPRVGLPRLHAQRLAAHPHRTPPSPITAPPSRQPNASVIAAGCCKPDDLNAGGRRSTAPHRKKPPQRNARTAPAGGRAPPLCTPTRTVTTVTAASYNRHRHPATTSQPPRNHDIVNT